MRFQVALALLSITPIYPVSLTEPAYPPQTLTGGTVVASLQVSSGEVSDVEILGGEEPFVTSVKAALSAWRFPRSTGGVRIPVVVHFRNPNLFPVGSPSYALPPSHQSGTYPVLPYPARVTEPVYPTNALGEGSVVLRLEIDEEGGVSKATEVKALGALTNPCVSAARRWQFIPAKDKAGKKVRSEAFVVCVFRHPVLLPTGPR